MNQVFAPGCTLMLYKPKLVDKLKMIIVSEFGEMPTLLTCCFHDPKLDQGTRVITVCSACDKSYRELYEGIRAVLFWEVLADSVTFNFPDYKGVEMAIQDTCYSRKEERYLNAIRKLLARMNIKVIEPKLTGSKAICCGDHFYGKLPVEQVNELMKKRAQQMPCEEVVVSCVSCIKSMYIGGKKPRFIIDLLFREDTLTDNYETQSWHKQMEAFIEAH
ncbi:(Fe-S)-binding protein [Clostridium sp. FP2]|nr:MULTISPECIES: (Fe-S)-binding protein [Clostridium]MBW9157662.1 (Fe-S)-binding protein [Clostridium tagluense]MBZ9622743.1 (Fe-S)-binding protein [Clostridium sp. FP2]WLC67023.1 (Fe-S)-binding protein [Clostridium tagluense]